MKRLKNVLIKFSLNLAASSPCVWFAYSPKRPKDMGEYGFVKTKK